MTARRKKAPRSRGKGAAARKSVRKAPKPARKAASSGRKAVSPRRKVARKSVSSARKPTRGAARPARKAAGSAASRGAEKSVYFFGAGRAAGRASMRELLGGKGANLAEMTRLGVPVPPGFTISTTVCAAYQKHGGRLPAAVKRDSLLALAKMEKLMHRRFGDPERPLLVSVRSGARVSMPGIFPKRCWKQLIM